MRRLEEAGAHVMSAVDGEDALRQLGNTTPDLLLIDLQMPGLDGVGVIRRLREAPPDRAYPVFVLSSHISGPQAAEARATGADAVFTKPVQVAALAAAFRARRGDAGRSTPRAREALDEVDEPLLDPDTFHETISIMDPSQAGSLVTEFEKTMRADLAALQTAINAGNMTLSSEVAHRALGLCLVMGAISLASQLRRIEVAAITGGAGIARGLVTGLDPILMSTLSQMRSPLVTPASSGF